MQALVTAWQRLWWAPVDARSVAVMRITLGLLLIASHLLLVSELPLLYSDSGPVSTATITDGSPYLRFSYLDNIADERTLLGVHLLGLVPLIGLTVGWRSRLMAVSALVVQVALHHRAPWAQHGGDRVLRLWVLSMCFVPSGAALSVDAWRGRGARTVPVIAHRLVQLQLCIIYLFTGIAKLHGGTWIRGEALYYALSSRTFQRFPGLLEPVLASAAGQGVLKGLTWLTLGWELAFLPMVLWPRTRTLALLIGVAVHLGIAATMMVGSFSFAMLWAYQAFLPPPASRR